MLGMLREVEVRAVGHTFQLSVAWGGEGEAVFHVERAASIFGVVGQFIGIMGPQQEILALHSDRAPPVLPGFTPEFIPLWCIVTVAEEFEFHLFKFPGTENEVPWGDFVAERFPDLGDAERHSNPRSVAHIFEVQEDALGGFGSKIGRRVLVLQCADVGLEHEVELARLGQGARFFGIGPNGDGEFSRGDRLDAADVEQFIGEFRFHVLLQLLPCFAQRGIVTADEGENLSVGVPFSAQEAQVICAVPSFGFSAVHHGVVEAAHVTRCFPHSRILDDGRIKADDRHGLPVGTIGGALDHVVPPRVANVVLEGGPKRPVIPESIQAAIDFTGRKNEATSFAETDDGFHGGGIRHDDLQHARARSAWSKP